MSDSSTGLIKLLKIANAIPDINDIADQVIKLRQKYPNEDPLFIAKQAGSQMITRLTGIGMLSSLPGVIPGFGTAAQITILATTLTAETAILLQNVTKYQYLIAGLYDHDLNEIEKNGELQIVWAMTVGVVHVGKFVGKMGARFTKNFVQKRISGTVLRSINKRIGMTVLTKFGTKRGGIALGKVLPLGIGVAIGGGINYAFAKKYVDKVIEYYSLPPDAEIIIEESKVEI